MKHLTNRRCTVCGDIYTPTSPTQTRCPHCREMYYYHGGKLHLRRSAEDPDAEVLKYKLSRLRVLDDLHILITEQMREDLLDKDISECHFDALVDHIISDTPAAAATTHAPTDDLTDAERLDKCTHIIELAHLVYTELGHDIPIRKE